MRRSRTAGANVRGRVEKAVRRVVLSAVLLSNSAAAMVPLDFLDRVIGRAVPE
jgi:hypothetical protein